MRPEDQSVWGLPPSDERDQGYGFLTDESSSPSTSLVPTSGRRAEITRAVQAEFAHLGLFRDDEKLPPRKTALVSANPSSTALVAPYRVDGSRHSGNYAWANTPTFERLWRETAAARIELLVKPEIADLMRREDMTIRFRYLEPSHLQDPWTPSLVMNLWWMHAMIGNYRRYNDTGHFVPWWEGDDPSDPDASMGERVFQISIATFGEAGLEEQVKQAEEGLALFRKRTLWSRGVFRGWRTFYVGVPESVTCPLEINNPEAWHLFVLMMRAVHPTDWENKLRRMRKLPEKQNLVMNSPFKNGARWNREHGRPKIGDPWGEPRKEPEAPKLHYFGTMAEHSSDVFFGDWVAQEMPKIDFFSTELW